MSIAYATTDDAKQWVDTHDPQAGAQFSDLAEVASRRIDYICNRSFAPPGNVDEARVYPMGPAYIDDAYEAVIGDLAGEPAKVEVALNEFYYGGATGGWFEVDAANYRLPPPREVGGPYTRIRVGGIALGDRLRQVRVTGRWGWVAVPPPVRTACLLLIARLHRRQSSPLGGETVPGIGGEIIVQSVERDDPDVRTLLAPYRRKAVA